LLEVGVARALRDVAHALQEAAEATDYVTFFFVRAPQCTNAPRSIPRWFPPARSTKICGTLRIDVVHDAWGRTRGMMTKT
jgi:hypothetical protein